MIRLLALYLTIAFLYGCSATHPPVEPLPPQYDKWGCLMPPQVVALNNQGLNLEAISFRDFAIGKVDYKSTPDLRTLLEKEAVNSLVAEYLLCNAKARGDINFHLVDFHLHHFPVPGNLGEQSKSHR